DVRHPVERKVGRRQRVVGAALRARAERGAGVAAAGLAGIPRVLQPVFRTGVEVAARARHAVVARRLLLPEQRLAEDDGRLLVDDEVGEVRRLLDDDRLEGGRRHYGFRRLLCVHAGHRRSGGDVDRGRAGNQHGRLGTDTHGLSLLVLQICVHDRAYWTDLTVAALVV